MATRRNNPCETDVRNGMRTCSRPQPHLHRCHAHLVLRNVTVGPCALLLAVGLLVLTCALPVFAAGVGEGSAGGAGWAESGQPVGWGIPDMRATAGRAFMYQVPGDVFGTTVDSFKVTEVDSKKLPHWLEFDQSTRTIFGVPMVTDEGLYYISVVAMATDSTQSTSDIFQLEVVLTESTAQPESLQFDPIQGDFLQVREKTTNTKMSVEDSQKSNTVCYNGETRAVVRLSVNVEDLPPRQRVDLVVKFADFVRRDPQSLKLTQRRSSNVGKLLEESVLVAGPGNANISTVLSLHTSTELSWRLSCGLFRGVEDFSKVMEHNAMEGVLTRVLGHGVVGWQVTSSASREQRRRRQAAGFATPMPTPTTTLFPPSSIPTATPVSLSSLSAFSTAPLPSLPSLSTQPLSPTVTPSLVASPTLEATESFSFLPVTPSTGISPSPVATVMPASSTPVVTSMSPPLAPSTASTLGVLPTFTGPDLSLEPSSPVLSFSPTVTISGISSLSLPTVVFETTSFTAAIQPTATSVREEPTTTVQLLSSTLPSTGIGSSMELSTTPSITAVFTTSSQLSLTPSPTPGSTSALATDIEVQSSTPVLLPTSVSAVATSLPTSSTLSTLPTPSLPVVSSTAALVSNSTLSTLPTPSPAVVSSTAVVSSSSTPTVPPNQPPLLVNHLDHLQVAAGQVYYSRVPYDTFYDMEDAMNTRGLTLELVALDGTTWLLLNDEWQALYGIPPLDSANQIYHFILVAYDSQGLATRDSFQLTVTQPPTPSHIFTAVIDIDYNTFQPDILSWISLSEKISTHFRDRTTNFILIDSVEEGSVVFSWSNISLSSTTCQNSTIQRLAEELINPDRTVNPDFVTSLSPEYPVTEARVRYQGVCDLAVVSPLPTTAATLAPAPLSHSNHLLSTVVPAACIAAILLLLGVIACCLYRSKKSGKKLPKYDKLTLTKNRKPIVLEDEVEMKDTKPSKPIVLPDEKPPATHLPTRRPAPPPYRIPDTQQLLSGMEPQAAALPPPPRYTASVPRKPPPPYRLPPPYTPSASPLPAPLSFADTKV
ncbi:dystroglycan 1-like isoform X2 [Branchiostoma lanceolatum]|uniref:dystroglycan 1-like isoform X2 n=1 Tax=Branchiostoma lanceolatum TaxID=7740 RepID=UPI0034540C17